MAEIEHKKKQYPEGLKNYALDNIFHESIQFGNELATQKKIKWRKFPNCRL